MSRELNRRDFLQLAAAGALAAPIRPSGHPSRPPPAPARAIPFELEELTIADLQAGQESGRFSARTLAEAYLQRIAELDHHGPSIRSVIEINPEALAIARGLDGERRRGRVRGPLHGIPVLIKDNIDTADRMATTAGSLALAGARPAADAFLVARLREAGAVIIGKTNLSEWANFRSTNSSSGWSGRGGQTLNPYALDRNPCGSSSGSAAAVSANFCAVAVGTETDGSIVCPSNACGIVGIKPTLGLVSRAGVVPIAHSQDTAGPMGRTVADAVTLLGVLAGSDPRDPATAAAATKGLTDYRSSLDPAGLRGARLGIVRQTFGFHAEVDRLMEQAMAAMRQAGAVIVDPADIETIDKYGHNEHIVLHYEFKADLNAYLAGLAESPVRSLAQIIAFNEANREREMPFFGQETFLEAETKGPLTDQTYLDALAENLDLSRRQGIDAVMDRHNLDALLAPTGGPAWTTDHVNGDHFGGDSSTPAAVSGYPSITVPVGAVFGLPVGVSFFGRAWSEPTLIRLAFAFEQLTRHRRAPRFRPSLGL
ncbi:MAG: amidase [Gemmatimonadales bacterium]